MSWRRSMAASIVMLLMAACGFIPETRSWKESVRLDDGSMITIERYVKFKRVSSWSGDVHSDEDVRATLSFTGELADLPAWDVPLMPMVLYRDARNEWVIVAGTDRCEIWAARGHPFPPYWEYRLVGKQWLQRPLSDSSKGRATNLFMDYRAERIPPHVGIERKRVLLSGRAIDEKYGRIVPDLRRYCMVNAPSQSPQ